MKKSIVLAFLSVFVTGCASYLKTYDSDEQPSVGIPIATPVLVKIVEITNYSVDPKQASYSDYCTPVTSSKYEFLALGKRSYIAFDPAVFGKGEFKVEFTDSGALKSVSLNSDATAGAEGIKDLLGTVLPFLAAPKPTAAVAALVDDTAQQKRDKYCIKKGTEVLSVERVDIK
ncbi:MAG: hypothetical protein V5B34_00605 [Accumulibacter sp.]